MSAPERELFARGFAAAPKTNFDASERRERRSLVR
jgi:hypothetical protein